jgi:hypothetical protein
MNQELIDMATKVGIEFTNDPTENPMTTFVECWIEELERFAKLVTAAEREACAKLIEATSLNGLKDNPAMQSWIAEMLFAYVKAIRARGETK